MQYEQYQAGVIIIDLVERESGSVIYRGSAEGELHEDVSMEERAAKLDDLVPQILKGVPAKR